MTDGDRLGVDGHDYLATYLSYSTTGNNIGRYLGIEPIAEFSTICIIFMQI